MTVSPYLCFQLAGLQMFEQIWALVDTAVVVVAVDVGNGYKSNQDHSFIRAPIVFLSLYLFLAHFFSF